MNGILSIEDLVVQFYVRRGVSRVLNGFHLALEEGELLGLVGESGSGKTVLANALLGHVVQPGKIIRGRIVYRGTDLRTLDEKELTRRYRGKEIGLIAANARSHLNPLMRVGDLIADVVLAHQGGTRKEAYRKAVEVLRAVGINDPENRLRSYPHELSGGMAQRVMIALSLINSPQLLIADDCTNGLDVTVAAQVMDLFVEMFSRRGSSGILITHDLGLVAQYCGSIAIMYCGQIIERAPVNRFFESPVHPYSVRLLEALPERRKDRMDAAGLGKLPSPLELPEGCLYHPRCAHAQERCRQEEPPLAFLGNGHHLKCFNPVSRPAADKVREGGHAR